MFFHFQINYWFFIIFFFINHKNKVHEILSFYFNHIFLSIYWSPF